MGKLSQLDRSVAGKVVLVTGAASGMGRATARLFADEGARVAAADLDHSGVEAVVGEITEAGLDAVAYGLDVADQQQVEEVVASLTEHFGGLDILVNNAGISLPTAIDGDEYAQRWERSIQVLLTAHTLTIRAALPHLRRSESPRIVNIASTEGLGATRGTSPYTAAKHAVIGLTRSLAVELGQKASPSTASVRVQSTRA